MTHAVAKKHAPATGRNREAIAAVLASELPESGIVLEVASGSGEHALFFADRFEHLAWQPTDSDRDAIASIEAYRRDYTGSNLRKPVTLDASDPARWPVKAVDAVLCINMVHIAPWEATEGLFAGAARVLAGLSAPLILYGPFFDRGIEPAPSNLQFDASLRARDPRWGIRQIEELDECASGHQLARTAPHRMPANNLVLVYRRTA